MAKKLPQQGFTKPSFSIIHHRNSPNDAVTLDGYTVKRESKLFLKSFGRFFPCAPYEAHFLYLDPSKKIGRWSPMCTCGSAGGVVNYDAYKRDASPQGAMIVCLYHAQYGYHQDGTKG